MASRFCEHLEARHRKRRIYPEDCSRSYPSRAEVVAPVPSRGAIPFIDPAADIAGLTSVDSLAGDLVLVTLVADEESGTFTSSEAVFERRSHRRLFPWPNYRVGECVMVSAIGRADHAETPSPSIGLRSLGSGL